MTSQGSPQTRFERALRTGNGLVVRLAAAELPGVHLENALRICLVLAVSEPERYPPAAARWLGRLLVESRDVTLEQAEQLARALRALPDEPRVAADLVPVCAAHRWRRGEEAVRAFAGEWTC